VTHPRASPRSTSFLHPSLPRPPLPLHDRLGIKMFPLGCMSGHLYSPLPSIRAVFPLAGSMCSKTQSLWTPIPL
jgi:hypothetical protein